MSEIAQGYPEPVDMMLGMTRDKYNPGPARFLGASHQQHTGQRVPYQ
eukprot:CAMPEP_0198240778 /NCGR_PEP_ID=MMETSP1446-20131203/5787_1 /TAXON_ID=1461542 ORGANISM="Unidentified sp, Strain CCMP2111" /NCGR_SAMPLE_ID=MMETSP1446 /ASSEMBLY_ACC=CAM_ASM_001112 /LENGTH=46 /DNA_ID= /DNA_START= /DNA_END= /DNA_ORIENTATION=